MTIPVLDLKFSEDPKRRGLLLDQLRDALFNIGFLYVSNHGVPEPTVLELATLTPVLFGLSDLSKLGLFKLNSSHFLGYSGFAEETTQGKRDLREQFDFATELPVILKNTEVLLTQVETYRSCIGGCEGPINGPRKMNYQASEKHCKSSPSRSCLVIWLTFRSYHDALSELLYRFVHLVEEAFGISVGIFDQFFETPSSSFSSAPLSSSKLIPSPKMDFLSPQHRLKLVKYPVAGADGESQGVGPHKDSSGWLTFLHQVGTERGLEVLNRHGDWLPANPIAGTFVVNFGNAFEAATEGAVRATVHRVKAPTQKDRYSIPFFMGLPLDLKISEIRSFVPEDVRSMRRKEDGQQAVEAALPNLLDPRWDTLGESVLRKWIRSHKDVGLKWYGPETLEYYTQ